MQWKWKRPKMRIPQTWHLVSNKATGKGHQSRLSSNPPRTHAGTCALTDLCAQIYTQKIFKNQNVQAILSHFTNDKLLMEFIFERWCTFLYYEVFLFSIRPFWISSLLYLCQIIFYFWFPFLSGFALSNLEVH